MATIVHLCSPVYGWPGRARRWTRGASWCRAPRPLPCLARPRPPLGSSARACSLQLFSRQARTASGALSRASRLALERATHDVLDLCAVRASQALSYSRCASSVAEQRKPCATGEHPGEHRGDPVAERDVSDSSGKRDGPTGTARSLSRDGHRPGCATRSLGRTQCGTGGRRARSERERAVLGGLAQLARRRRRRRSRLSSTRLSPSRLVASQATHARPPRTPTAHQVAASAPTGSRATRNLLHRAASRPSLPPAAPLTQRRGHGVLRTSTCSLSIVSLRLQPLGRRVAAGSRTNSVDGRTS